MIQWEYALNDPKTLTLTPQDHMSHETVVVKWSKDYNFTSYHNINFSWLTFQVNSKYAGPKGQINGKRLSDPRP